MIYSPDIKTNTNKLLEWKIVTLYFLCFPWCWLRNYLHHLQKVSTRISGATRTMVRSKVERPKHEVYDASWAYHHQRKIGKVWSIPKKNIRHKTLNLIEQDEYSYIRKLFKHSLQICNVHFLHLYWSVIASGFNSYLILSLLIFSSSKSFQLFGLISVSDIIHLEAILNEDGGWLLNQYHTNKTCVVCQTNSMSHEEKQYFFMNL